ncbi:MAG TPA: NUDIX hydrolase [Actinomycetota bacterium]
MSDQSGERPSFLLRDASGQPAEPRDSATIILARDGTKGLEVFMLERVLKADFAGGAYVFPGGTFDDGDLDPALAALTDGVTPAQAAAAIDAPPDRALAFYLCAIRETFEESGALMARRDGTLVGHDASLQDARPSLNDGTLKLKDFAQREGLRFAADLLHPWSRWITPEASPKRYDTRFFVAAFPDGGEALRHDEGESSSSTWIRPADALARHAEGRFTVIFPTRVTLTQLARFDRAGDLIAASPGRDVSPVQPEIVQAGDAIKILVPGDPEPYDP